MSGYSRTQRIQGLEPRPLQYLEFGALAFRVVYHLLGKTGWSTAVVNGTRQLPNGYFHAHAFVPFPRLFPGRYDQRRSKPKGLELVKTSKFPFGNSVPEFWSTFQEIPFSLENFRSGRQMYIPSAISGILG